MSPLVLQGTAAAPAPAWNATPPPQHGCVTAQPAVSRALPPSDPCAHVAGRLADLARFLFASPEALVWLTCGNQPGRPGTSGDMVPPSALPSPQPTGGPPTTGGRRLPFQVAARLPGPQGQDLGTLHVALPRSRPGDLAIGDRHRMGVLSGIAAEMLDLRLRLRAATQALAEKELLAREADHRVANGLQLIHGTLSLQASAESAAASRTALRTAARRVAAVAGAHRHLYRAVEPMTDAAAYLAALVRDLAPPPGPAEDAVASRPVLLDTEPGVVVPAGLLPRLGLITAELVANALKHGTGRVLVELRQVPPAEGDGVLLAVSDQGQGFPPSVDPAAPSHSGLGMRLVAAMAQPGGAWIEPEDRRRIVVRLVDRLAPDTTR